MTTTTTTAPPSPVRAVTFDLDGTLYALARVRWPLLLRNLTRLRALRVGRAVREELRSSPQLADGNAMLREEARLVAERLGLAGSGAARDLLDDIFRRQLCAVLAKRGRDARVRASIERLVGAGVAVGVISDRVVDEKLRALALDDLPWGALVSGDETGLLKPSPAPFALALAKLRVPASEAVHVGDRDDADGAGAAAAGMRFMRVDGPADLPGVVDEILRRS